MYGKRFLAVSRIGVYIAVIALVGVTLFGSIAPASPTLEKTKRNLERDNVRFGLRLFGELLTQDDDYIQSVDVGGSEY